MKEHWDRAQVFAEQWNAEEVLRWAFFTYGKRMAMASGFGVEGMALIDIASRVLPDLKVFTLDTEFLFSETYDLIDRVEKRYGIKVERIYSTLPPEAQQRIHGPALWTIDPDKCCSLRKIEPLRQKLSELRAWITAIRRDQTSARSSAGKVEWDAKFELVKINPIADWTNEMVWNYVRKHNVPYNPLHDRNYPSIGCTHCTRPVQPGEDMRAGRWSGSQKTECGLHIGSAVGPLVRIEGQVSCEE